MVTLKQMAEGVNKYLELHGNKDIISIGTYNGSSPIEYELDLADVYAGEPGSNPYTGRDHLKLMRDGGFSTGEKGVVPEAEPMEGLMGSLEKEAGTDVMKAYFELEQDLRKQDTPVEVKMAVLHGALSVMYRMGAVSSGLMTALWNDFSLDMLGLQ